LNLIFVLPNLFFLADSDPDHFIRVTDISPGGAVFRDGRIKVGDVIMKVNATNCMGVPHDVVVEALKQSGNLICNAYYS
jgi:C-terminal processing protease CtpA/Prc